MKDSVKIALISGASSGLGKEYLDFIVNDKCGNDEIWIIARRANILNELASKYNGLGKKIVPIGLDLSSKSSFSELNELLLQRENIEISILINNAGVGTHGEFSDCEIESQTNIIDINCRALTALCLIGLQFMKKGGRIINVCSIASFAPTPYMTVYCSTKSYVLSFSRSLNFELKKKGISVMAVCPGPMDTEFLGIAGIKHGVSKTFDTLPRSCPSRVAEKSLKLSKKGRAVYTPGLFFKFYRIIAKILPHFLVMKLSKT